MEFKTVSIPVDGLLQSELEKLHQEGWRLIAGCTPMATYALCREPAPAQPSMAMAFGKLEIDDSKVFVTKAGDPVPS